MLSLLLNIFNYHRYKVFLLTLLLLIISSYGTTKLWVTVGAKAFLTDNDPLAIENDKLQERYGFYRVVGLAIIPNSGNIFDKNTLEAITQFTNEALKIPYSISVSSLSNYKYIYNDKDQLVIESLFDSIDHSNKQALSEIQSLYKNDALANNRLFSDKGHITLALVNLAMPEDSRTAGNTVYEAITEIKERYSQQFPDITFLRVGSVMIEHAFAESASRDLRVFFPLASITMVLLLFIMLRNTYAVYLTLLILLIDTIISMGLKGYINGEISPVSALSPTVIMTLAIADCIYILVCYLKLVSSGVSKKTAIEESLRMNYKAITLTSFTTVIGFLCFNFSSSPTIRDMGNTVAIGVITAWYLSLFFLPALIMSLPVGRKESVPLFAAFMPKLARTVMSHSGTIIIVALIVVPLSVVGISKNSVNEVLSEMFDDSFEIVRTSKLINRELNGVQRIFFDFPARDEGGINDVEYLATLEQFSVWLKKQDIVRDVEGYHDLIKRINQVMLSGDKSDFTLPASRELAAQYLLLYEMSTDTQALSLIDHKHSRTKLSVYIDNTSSNSLIELNNAAAAWLKENAPEYMQIKGLGGDILFSITAKTNSETMYYGTVVAIILISILMLFALGSVKLGAIGLLTNLAPIAMAYGIWGYIDGRIGISVAMVATLCMGIVVDDSVHLLIKFKDSLKRNANNVEVAIQSALEQSGNAIMITSALFIATFGLMLVSSYVPNNNMGLLAAITIAYALLFDLLVLPAALFRLYSTAPSTNLSTTANNNSNDIDKQPIEKFRLIDSPYPFKVAAVMIFNFLFGPSKKYREETQWAEKDFIANVIDSQYSFLFVGDFLSVIHFELDFDKQFRELAESSDYLVVNLEGIIFKGPKIGLFSQYNLMETFLKLTEFKCPNRIIVSIANNHAADHGFHGLNQCIKQLEDQGFIVIGTKDNKCLNINNDINITAITELSNQPSDYLPSLSDATPKEGVYNILYPHWGNEFELYPRPAQIETAKRLIEDWDIIVGHHSHVPQPVSVFTDKNKLKKIVAYSLGDFAIHWMMKKFHYGITLRVEIGKTDQGVWATGRTQHFFNYNNRKPKKKLVVELKDDCPMFVD